MLPVLLVAVCWQWDLEVDLVDLDPSHKHRRKHRPNVSVADQIMPGPGVIVRRHTVRDQHITDVESLNAGPAYMLANTSRLQQPSRR